MAVYIHAESGEKMANEEACLKAYLKRNVVVSNTNLKLLLADDVLLRPVRVVFLGDLARLDDPPELLHDKRADPHCRTRPTGQ